MGGHWRGAQPSTGGSGECPEERTTHLRPKGQLRVSQSRESDGPGRMYHVPHVTLAQDGLCLLGEHGRSSGLMMLESLECCAQEFANQSKSNREPLKQGRNMLKLCSRKEILVVICK